MENYPILPKITEDYQTLPFWYPLVDFGIAAVDAGF
jgi:hypothetical protein